MKYRELFGEMLIPKDTILYHTSDRIYTPNRSKQMLFCTFHPSEWEGLDHKYIYFVKLLKNTKLLFMVSHFNRRRVISGLPIIAGQPNISNLSKQSESFLMKFLPKLEAEDYDGWFSSIENKGYTEVALLNKNTIFKVVKTEELTRKWRNSNHLNSVLLKDWGTKYPIGKNIILYLPSSYQKKIRDYKECSAQSRTPYDFVFEMIVRDSMIYYF